MENKFVIQVTKLSMYFVFQEKGLNKINDMHHLYIK